MAAPRKYGTCFFEQYAQISLCRLLGSEFDCLVNRDRPDLQSEGSDAIGIEVTRAMEESRRAEQQLLKDVAGITPDADDAGGSQGNALDLYDDMDAIVQYGYAYGLKNLIGPRELPYWEMALPLRRIIESKVQKVGNGFYGHFRKMGLFVFCKDQLGEAEALKTMNYTLSIQRDQDIRYDRLYLADVDDLFVCNLADGLQSSSRLSRYPITQQQRKDFFREAVRRQEAE